ncbi:hypothetical protein ACWGID_23540 [Kribbella sp. NPDC054772]
MKVMGERLPEAWIVEMHRNGRVEFPLRRSPIAQPPMLFVVVVSLSYATRIPDILDSGDRLLGYLMILGYLAGLVAISWQLITQRPLLVVDQRGIHLGRRRSMLWTEISSIGVVSGPRLFRRLEVFPKDIWAKNLTLAQSHVNDLESFRTWLDEVLAEQQHQLR